MMLRLRCRLAAAPSADKVRTPPPGADDRQVPAQHIEELRQAVDVRPAKKPAYSSDGRAILEPWPFGMAFLRNLNN